MSTKTSTWDKVEECERALSNLYSNLGYLREEVDRAENDYLNAKNRLADVEADIKSLKQERDAWASSFQ